MFRIESKDADALGIEVQAAPVTATAAPAGPMTQEQLEKKVWESLKTCYDPEIPVNIVDLGLIYDCHLTSIGPDNYKADVKMTLTAPGCGMGPVLAQDVQNKLISLEPIDEANVELVWDPPWNQGMLSEAAKLQLGVALIFNHGWTRINTDGKTCHVNPASDFLSVLICVHLWLKRYLFPNE